MRTKASAEYGGYLETNISVLGSEGHVVKNNDDQNATKCICTGLWIFRADNTLAKSGINVW